MAVDPGIAEVSAGPDPDALGPPEVAAVPAFAGLGAGALPRPTAPVLALLDALPVPLKERLLTEFVGAVFRV